MLVLLTDDARLPDARAAANALPKTSLVIVRAKKPAQREERVRALMPIVRKRGLILLVADDPALARTLGAHGVHLPEKHARQASRLRAQNPGWLITVAAHSLRAALLICHADAILLSPVFATKSHPGAPSLSPARARLIARGVKTPLFALGGITAQNAALLSGFSGIAAIGALA